MPNDNFLSISAVPSPPSNLSLTEILSDGVEVTWDADVRERITIFEMTIHPLSGSLREFKVISRNPQCK